MSKHFLITGAGGYLGGRLLEKLAQTEAEITAISRKDRPEGLSSNIEWKKADILAPDFWASVLHGGETVFHLAGQTSSKWADEHPDQDFKINVQPILNLIEIARNYFPGNLSVIFSGTVTQCGIPEKNPVSEMQPDRPVTVYDRHKLEAENRLLEASRLGILRGVSLRLSNLYGPGKTEGSSDRGILNAMSAKAARGQALRLIRKAENLTRDYLFIDDAVDAMIAAAENSPKLSGCYFVLGSGTGITIGEAFRKISNRAFKMIGKKSEILFSDEPLLPVDRRNFTADSAMFRNLTGWAPKVSFEEGILRALEFLK